MEIKLYYAVDVFSAAETITGGIEAAEERKSPAILQIAQVRLLSSPLFIVVFGNTGKAGNKNGIY